LDRHQALLDGYNLDLTPTEFSFLQALAGRPGYAWTRLELIESAFGYGYEGLERTVDSHIKNLRRKLDALSPSEPGADWIETVFGIGYRLRSNLDESAADQR
jgi:two-component system alkaline phosphatase synthesis response regulator PhoP